LTRASSDDVVARLRAAGCVFAEDEAALLLAAGDEVGADLDALVARRVAGEPLEYVLGWASFCGRRIAVDPGVFVPRRRTEFLARAAARLVTSGAVAVDLCCGTGAIGVVLADAGAEVHAVDIDPAAVACACRNLTLVHAGDLFDALPVTLHGHVDIVVANAPYVPTDAMALMPPEARDHEAPVALDGGSDGLDVQRRIVAEARTWLRTGGHLLVETSVAQAPATTALFDAAGMRASAHHDDAVDGTYVHGIA
jgi:release factor glutamine methyltransferase